MLTQIKDLLRYLQNIAEGTPVWTVSDSHPALRKDDSALTVSPCRVKYIFLSESCQIWLGFSLAFATSHWQNLPRAVHQFAKTHPMKGSRDDCKPKRYNGKQVCRPQLRYIQISTSTPTQDLWWLMLLSRASFCPYHHQFSSDISSKYTCSYWHRRLAHSGSCGTILNNKPKSVHWSLTILS